MSELVIESTRLLSDVSDSEQGVQRTGDTWSAVAHIITGVIGAGVLSLAWSTAQLGWIAGPLCIILFAITTVLSSYLLCDCYRYPDPESGIYRNRSYIDAVRHYLGETNQKVSGILVNESLCGTSIAYVFTTASSVSAVAHIITAIIGSGVLSLAWSTSQLGWIAGPVSLLGCAIVTYISTCLLSECYRTLDPVSGKRNYSYRDAVRVCLGKKRTCLAAFLQYLNLCGTSIAYVITTATSLRAILKSNCYHKEGHNAPCHYGEDLFMVLFGVVQIFMSFIPDLHTMGWLSVVAAVMSFTYSFIGLGLGIAQVIENGTVLGSITGVPTSNIIDKLWLVFQALGDIAFAYPYAVLLIEIQDTLASPPPENQTMKKASLISVLTTTFFYLCCGCFGYAAFGNDTPGNLLTGFGFYEPYWLVDFANACIVVHLVGGYQIYSQPIFASADRWSSRKFPNSGFVNKFYNLKLPFLPLIELNLFRICFRTVYVIFTTGIAILFPYFNEVLGVLGALNFWPLAIYFPVEMYFVQKKIGAWTPKWILLRSFSFVCCIVSIVGLAGSIEGLISEKLSS